MLRSSYITPNSEELAYLQSIVENSNDYIFLVNPSTLQFSYGNKRLLTISGYKHEELYTLALPSLDCNLTIQKYRQKLAPLLEGTMECVQLESTFTTHTGSKVPVKISFYFVKKDNSPGMLIGVAKDLSELKHQEEKLQYMQYHDQITTLPNRTYLQNRLTEEVELAERENHLVAVLFLDLDRFKVINDTLGHTTGDKLLQQVGERLHHLIKDADTLARSGGDEFTIIAPYLHRAEQAASLAERIIEELQEPFYCDGQELHVTSSIGISLFPSDGNATSLLQNADIALYRAKKQGGNIYQFYTPTLNARALERFILENSLRHAIEREEFIVYYQPRVHLATNQIIGAEALIRWRHPELGIISPRDFISLAEETGLILPISQWVLHTATEQAKQWQRKGLPPITVAVNLSLQQINHPQFLDHILEALHTSDLPPNYLELEVTENVIMEHNEKTVEALEELRRIGVQFSIDDFGTGYSSLSQLKHFPISCLKIDRSFVRDCIKNVDDAAIITAIISMSHSLEMEVVAEGVETAEQLGLLQSLECDVVQGFLFSKPVPPEEFTELLEQQCEHYEDHTQTAAIATR